MVRDTALAASGLLVDKIGGPFGEAISARRRMGSGRDVVVEHASLSARYRRQTVSPKSVHVLEAQRATRVDGHLQRPSRENCTVRRERTNTPLQALVTMNDTQFVEAARHLAETRI